MRVEVVVAVAESERVTELVPEDVQVLDFAEFAPRFFPEFTLKQFRSKNQGVNSAKFPEVALEILECCGVLVRLASCVRYLKVVRFF